MLINLTNHPYEHWSKEQKEAAERQFGEVVDMQFPDIPADADDDYVVKLAVKYANKIENLFDSYVPKGGKITRLYDNGVHLMGEMTFCYALIDYLGTEMDLFYASTAERRVSYDDNGNKVVDFKFVNFRNYRSYFDKEEYDEEYDDDYDDDYEEEEGDKF